MAEKGSVMAKGSVRVDRVNAKFIEVTFSSGNVMTTRVVLTNLDAARLIKLLQDKMVVTVEGGVEN